ncbi:hypothetical protein KSP40_PGU009014 [Platanthera guangdongensis]|uniref:MICOS complex subunit MIC10 n=1 Tax=Platanthera guangdongensis TaxID=2320717 RepID=A0ABR2MV46_9ASPA
MAEEEKTKSRHALGAKWDACLDLTIRRIAYTSLAGTLTGLLLFRSPITRWASVAFGAGVGIGTAYTECSYIFDGSVPKWTSPKISSVSYGSSQVRFLVFICFFYQVTSLALYLFCSLHIYLHC